MPLFESFPFVLKYLALFSGVHSHTHPHTHFPLLNIILKGFFENVKQIGQLGNVVSNSLTSAISIYSTFISSFLYFSFFLLTARFFCRTVELKMSTKLTMQMQSNPCESQNVGTVHPENIPKLQMTLLLL